MTKLIKLPDTDQLIIGVDQSLTCTSVCFMQNQEVRFEHLKSSHMGVTRLIDYYNHFCRLLDACTDPIFGVAIEGYAFSATGRTFNLGEIGGVLRLACAQRKLAMIEVPPTHLKKFIAGKGNCSKDILIKEVYKNYELDTNDNNDCDAFCLSLVAYDYFNTELHPIKIYRTETQKKCNQIIGDHPKPLNHKEYFAEMPDVSVAVYEKMRRAKKKNVQT